MPHNNLADRCIELLEQHKEIAREEHCNLSKFDLDYKYGYLAEKYNIKHNNKGSSWAVISEDKLDGLVIGAFLLPRQNYNFLVSSIKIPQGYAHDSLCSYLSDHALASRDYHTRIEDDLQHDPELHEAYKNLARLVSEVKKRNVSVNEVCGYIKDYRGSEAYVIDLDSNLIRAAWNVDKRSEIISFSLYNRDKLPDELVRYGYNKPEVILSVTEKSGKRIKDKKVKNDLIKFLLSTNFLKN